MQARSLQALALLVGTIIGVGVFAIPFVSAGVGFFAAAIEILVLATLVLFVHLMYGDVVAVTPARHGLPGYVGLYLGKTWGRVSRFSHILGLTGSMVAYVLLGSSFLHAILANFWPAVSLGWSMALFFIIGLIIFFYDSSFSTEAEALLTFLLIAALSGLIGLGIYHGAFGFLDVLDVSQLPVPYGVILFALSGSVVIPRVYETFSRNHSGFRRVIIAGTVIPAVFYVGFLFAILAASPAGVSKDAISGLIPVLGGSAVFVGSLIGFLATITSYIGVGLAEKGLLQFDFGLPKVLAWLLTSVAPFVLIALGISDFIALIAFIGALAIGFDNLMIIGLWSRLPRHIVLRALPRILPWILGIAFASGMVYQIFSLFSL